jgi:hypothetical protein
MPKNRENIDAAFFHRMILISLTETEIGELCWNQKQLLLFFAGSPKRQRRALTSHRHIEMHRHKKEGAKVPGADEMFSLV